MAGALIDPQGNGAGRQVLRDAIGAGGDVHVAVAGAVDDERRRAALRELPPPRDRVEVVDLAPERPIRIVLRVRPGLRGLCQRPGGDFAVPLEVGIEAAARPQVVEAHAREFLQPVDRRLVQAVLAVGRLELVVELPLHHLHRAHHVDGERGGWRPGGCQRRHVSALAEAEVADARRIDARPGPQQLEAGAGVGSELLETGRAPVTGGFAAAALVGDEHGDAAARERLRDRERPAVAAAARSAAVNHHDGRQPAPGRLQQRPGECQTAIVEAQVDAPVRQRIGRRGKRERGRRACRQQGGDQQVGHPPRHSPWMRGSAETLQRPGAGSPQPGSPAGPVSQS